MFVISHHQRPQPALVRHVGQLGEVRVEVHLQEDTLLSGSGGRGMHVRGPGDGQCGGKVGGPTHSWHLLPGAQVGPRDPSWSPGTRGVHDGWVGSTPLPPFRDLQGALVLVLGCLATPPQPQGLAPLVPVTGIEH